MDALAALKMVAGPEMGTKLNGVMTDANAKAIPANELQNLTGATSTMGTANTLGTSGVGGVSAPENFANVQSGGSFSDLLGNFVGDVNAKQNAASDAVTGLMSGKNVSLHQAMISMEEASVSFSMMVEVRNKLLDSYQELMRMQI